MKKVNFLFNLLLITAVLGVLTSGCSKKDKDKIPDNEITDASGVKLELEWSTGGSTSTSLTEADLELRLYKGTTQVYYSATTSFEKITLTPNILADGDYTIKVQLYSGSKAISYSLITTGLGADPKIYTITGSMGQNTTPQTIDFATLKKSGNKFTITKLI